MEAKKLNPPICKTKIYKTKGNEFVFAGLDDLFLYVCNVDKCTDEQWSELCGLQSEYYAKEILPTMILNYSPKHLPTLRQRAITKQYPLLSEAIKNVKKISLLSSSPVARGIVTVFMWMFKGNNGVNIHIDSPSRHDEAIAQLCSRTNIPEHQAISLFRELKNVGGI